MNRSANLSIATAIGFLVVVFALLFLAPQVDPMRYGISFYGGTSLGPVLGLAFALIGVSALSLASALWTSSLSISGRIGRVLLGAWGAMCLLETEFLLNTPDAAPALLATHNLGVAMLSMLILAPAVLLIELSRASFEPQTGVRPVTYWPAWLVPVSAITLLIFNDPLFSLAIYGLVQRLYWFVLALWLVLKARQVLRKE